MLLLRTPHHTPLQEAQKVCISLDPDQNHRRELILAERADKYISSLDTLCVGVSR
jgi:hypothetical protein